MRFEWDATKSRANKAKHGVSFELATRVFADPRAISSPDDSGREERWLTVGLAGAVLILAVAHTWRDENNEEVIRIISARKATRYESQQYENQRAKT